jgi:hypothetical protein
MEKHSIEDGLACKTRDEKVTKQMDGVPDNWKNEAEG